MGDSVSGGVGPEMSIYLGLSRDPELVQIADIIQGLNVVLGEELGDPAQLPRVVTDVDVNAELSELGTPEQNVVCSLGNAMTKRTSPPLMKRG